MRSFYVLVCAWIAACSSGTNLQQTGAALSVDYFGDTDVIGFNFAVTRVMCDPNDTITPFSENFNVDLVDGIFPGNIAILETTLEEDSRHLGADLFISLEPGCYDIVATPAKAFNTNGTFDPSDDCDPATATKVPATDGLTEEAPLLISQCEGDEVGAIDQLVTLNHPPVISVNFNDDKFSYECETIQVCAVVYDVDDDPIVVEWQKVMGQTLYPNNTITSTKTVIGFENGHRVWEDCANITAKISGPYDLRATVFDLTADGTKFETLLQMDDPNATSSDSLDFNLFTNWIEDPLCFDNSGTLVDAGDPIVRAPGCTYTSAQSYYCGNGGGSLGSPDPAVTTFLCQCDPQSTQPCHNGQLQEDRLYPECPHL